MSANVNTDNGVKCCGCGDCQKEAPDEKLIDFEILKANRGHKTALGNNPHLHLKKSSRRSE